MIETLIGWRAKSYKDCPISWTLLSFYQNKVNSKSIISESEVVNIKLGFSHHEKGLFIFKTNPIFPEGKSCLPHLDKSSLADFLLVLRIWAGVHSQNRHRAGQKQINSFKKNPYFSSEMKFVWKHFVHSDEVWQMRPLCDYWWKYE